MPEQVPYAVTDKRPSPVGAHFGHREHPDHSMVNAQIDAW